jgi:predicted kinase
MSERKRLLVFFGMIATGKSHLAAAFAKKWGCAYHNSDIVRKELAGLAADSRQINTVDTGIYSSEFSRRTYDAVLARAQNDLKQKRYACVVLDGSYQSRSERQLLCQKIGKQHRVVFVHCQCSETVMKKRMDRRLKNPRAVSDGRWEIYLQQKKRFEMPVELPPGQLLTFDTDRPPADLLRLLEENLRKLEDVEPEH